MKNVRKICSYSLVFCACVFILMSFLNSSPSGGSLKFPYKQAGLTERQAAEHLLDRFTYGATPGQVDAVMKMGLENWFKQQLEAGMPDDSLDKRLNNYDAISLSNTEVCREYPPGFVIRSMAIKDSAINKDSVDKAVNKKAFNAQLQAYMDKKGYKSDQDLYKQFIDQNILRAVYTNNQLQEVLTDFWFNHFNVSFFKGECAQFIPDYERDVIRPNALGKFDQLLLASAKSPAMLYYLDNFSSVGPQPPAKPKPAAPGNGDMSMMMTASNTSASPNKVKTITQPGKNINGLNENYAREVMELHTLGVDGGYTQQDVTQAARVLTGWTVYPISDQAYGSAMKGLVAKIGPDNLTKKGFVRDSDFLFTPNRHDHGEKVVLGHVFPADNDPASGYQEGVDLLEMLAHHSSTAKFICRKLAVRFVSDNPPQRLIDKMAKSFMDNDGDIRAVLITMVSSKDFWDKKELLAKTKSPFELAVSAVRGTGGDVKDPYPLFNWIARMGEKIYYYQAPTGFPDRAQYWINTGALLNRMDFSLALASGVKVNVNKLAPVEPKNFADAINTYAQLLIPEQDPARMTAALSPLLNDPALAAKINKPVQRVAAAPAPAPEKPMAGAPGDMMLMSAVPDSKPKPAPQNTGPNNTAGISMQSLVVGIIIGSPEFQKR